MKTLQITICSLLLSALPGLAQEPVAPKGRLPISISLFSESVSLPNLKSLFKGGLGVKVGTELYYRNRLHSQLIQTLNVGYYYNAGWQQGAFISSEFGYRKYIGSFYADAFVGAGALAMRPQAATFFRNENGTYRADKRFQLKLMPTLGIGAGYRLRNQTTFFTRYELFGEMPFQVVVLPHQALHIGTRMLMK